MSAIITDVNFLRRKSQDVYCASEAQDIIDKIKPLLKEKHMVGIAAIQIGIEKKIAVMKNKDGYFYMINSQVIDKDEEFLFFNEGCLSFPNKYITTKRFEHYTIRNYRIENDNLEEEKLYFYYSNDPGEGDEHRDIFSIAVQHEIDHFDGILFVDREVKGETVKNANKVGRNDKCPCGSGKKYKKCCGA